MIYYNILSYTMIYCIVFTYFGWKYDEIPMITKDFIGSGAARAGNPPYLMKTQRITKKAARGARRFYVCWMEIQRHAQKAARGARRIVLRILDCIFVIFNYLEHTQGLGQPTWAPKSKPWDWGSGMWDFLFRMWRPCPRRAAGSRSGSLAHGCGVRS